MVAFNASKLVCSAIAVISFTTLAICSAARDSFAIRSSVRSAWETADAAMRLDSFA
jgi:hypothetical protein